MVTMVREKLQTIKQLLCKRCGKRWFPRKPGAILCPKCNMPYDQERVRQPGGGRKPNDE